MTDVDAGRRAGFKRDRIGAELAPSAMSPALADGDRVRLDRHVTASAAGKINFLHRQGDRGQCGRRAVGPFVRRACPCTTMLLIAGLAFGGGREDHAAVALAGGDAAAECGDFRRQAVDREGDVAVEAVSADRVHKDHAARARRQFGLVGVEREFESRLGPGDLQEIDELRTAALQQVANFDRVGAVGRRAPAFDRRVGRHAGPLPAESSPSMQRAALGIENADRRIERRTGAARNDLESQGSAALGVERKDVALAFLQQAAVDSSRRGRPTVPS